MFTEEVCAPEAKENIVSDKMNTQSLASLASATGAANREVAESRYRTVKSGVGASAAATAQRAGFGGFLNTFLGKDKAGAAPASGKARSGRSGGAVGSFGGRSAGKGGAGKFEASTGVGKAGSKMAAGDKKALLGSMDKTVAEESDVDAAHTRVEDYPPEVVAAAEEAAMLIWNLLYGPMGGDMAGDFDLQGQGGDALRQIAQLVNGGGLNSGVLDGIGTDGSVDLDALQQAIETANASAEMNNAAVLSALDELLDGMPRSALEDALSRTAGAMGLPAAGEVDVFNRIAAALEAEVTGVGGGEAELLSFLGGAASHAGAEQAEAAAQNIAPEAAENSGNIAGLSPEENELVALFQKFVEENKVEGPINETDSPSLAKGEKVFENFVEWLQENGNVKEAKQVASEPNRFVQALATGLGEGKAASGEAGEKTSWARMNLETLLQNSAATVAVEKPSTSDNGESILASGRTGSATEQGINNGAAVQQPQQQVPAAAQHSTANPAAMSTMLDQIENIERLAEAMKMANRNGVKHLTMELSPAELGKVMLRVEAKDGVVSAYLRVEKPEAAAQLGSSLDQLRQTLKQQGIELGELSLQQRGSNETLGDFSGQRQGGGREAGESRGGRHRGRPGGIAAETDAEPIQAASGKSGPGALNLFA